MSENSKLTTSCVKSLLESGVEKASSRFSLTRKQEFTVDAGSVALLRTTDDVSLAMSGIKNQKRGATSINKTDSDSVSVAIKELNEIIDASEPDPAHDIAPKQPQENFKKGPLEPDTDLMYTRLTSFLEYSKEKYPTLLLEQVVFQHTVTSKWFSNSNGVNFSSKRGLYLFQVMFSSKENGNTSSFNYAFTETADLSSELWLLAGVNRVMEQSVGQTVTKSIDGSFEGDVIITPECMGDFVRTITGFLTDYPLITNTSVYKHSLGEAIADKKISLHSTPVSDELMGGYFVTMDGFKAKNSSIIENGVLKTFLLSLYGANKTGLVKAVNSGGNYSIDSGDISFADMVKSVKKGILLCRFSGGNPASNGDFSGVAKNSYYIENGEIKYPISESMIAGNIKEMLFNVKEISEERVCNGDSIYPWITFTGVTVSGK